MIIGVPKETHRNEHRVGLTPFAVSRFTQLGHSVLVEREAGQAAHFTDQHYAEAGGSIVYSSEEIYKRSDLVCRVGRLSAEAQELLRRGSVICSFQHFAVAPRDQIDRLMELETTLIGYEIIRDEHGGRPVLYPFSEMAGQMAVHIAAHHLQQEGGGRGVLLGNVPGVPPPTVLILGAGTVGHAAARQALASGAHVIVLDEDLSKLTALNREFSGRVVTVLAAMERLERYTAIADVIIGAILIPGDRAPLVVTESMVKTMKPGSVVIDVSIDQGGCIETSRPTSLDDPTFVKHDVVHYCVPNLTANVSRTASRTLANAALPYLVELADKGLEGALRDDPGLAQGLFSYRGNIVNVRAGKRLGIPVVPLKSLLDEGEKR